MSFQLRRHSLHFRMVFSIFLIFVIPMMLLLFLTLRSQSHLAEEKAMRSSQSGVEQNAEILNSYFKRITAAMSTLDLNENLTQFLTECNRDGYTGSYSETRQALMDILEESSSAMSDIYVDMMIITNDGDIYGTSPFLSQRPQYSLEHAFWYSQIENNYSTLWMQSRLFDYILHTGSAENIYIARQLFGSDLYTPVGVLIFSLPQNEILKMYRTNIQDSQSAYLLDADGALISFVDNLGLGPALPEAVGDLGISYTRASIGRVGREKAFITYDTIDSNQWKLVLISDYDVYISYEQTRPLFLALIFLYSCLAACMVAILLYRKIFLPLKHLKTDLHQVEQGDFSVESPLVSNDEIGALAQSFNSMTRELDRLFQQVVQEQNLKRESDIKALQAQINPHFIYNTLSSIRYLIYMGDKKTADATILSLIRLLKSSLSSTSTQVPVYFEVSQLMEYLNIQKLSLSQPLTVHVNIDPCIRNCRINKLLLQPIVENAVMHGIKPKNAPGTICISGRPEGDDLLFEITDDGLGFDTGGTSAQPSKYFAERDHIGIQNVNQRIRLYYGEAYGVLIESAPGRGTRVQIRIPQIREEAQAAIHEYFDC